MRNDLCRAVPSRPRTERRRALPAALALGLALAMAAGRAHTAPEFVLNGQGLDESQRQALARQAGQPLAPGRWWYDTRSGLWGAEGGPAAGMARAGLEVNAPLPATASRTPGQPGTGVFFNGRELHAQEVAWLMSLGPVWPGRYWLDAWGNVGLEGQRLAFANLPALVAQRQGRIATNGSSRGGTWIASDRGCVIVSGKSSSGIGSFGASTC